MRRARADLSAIAGLDARDGRSRPIGSLRIGFGGSDDAVKPTAQKKVGPGHIRQLRPELSEGNHGRLR